SLDIEFTGAVRPGATYDVDIDRSSGSPVIVARSADGVLLRIRMTNEFGAWVDTSWASPAFRDRAAKPRLEAVGLDEKQLQPSLEVTGRFPTADRPAEYSGSGLAPVQARVLALCSYLVGMELPGRDALFTR